MIENLEKSHAVRCGTCRDAGALVVVFRPALNTGVPGYEEMGPCPYCEKGKRMEFPPSGQGPWGEKGYWQGRSPDFPKVMPEAPLPASENARLQAELFKRMGWIGKDVLPQEKKERT